MTSSSGVRGKISFPWGCTIKNEDHLNIPLSGLLVWTDDENFREAEILHQRRNPYYQVLSNIQYPLFNANDTPSFEYFPPKTAQV